MDADTIREARRLLHDLVFAGEARLSTGFMICPKADLLVLMLEKIASKKYDETPELPTVEGYKPQSTYHTREQGDAILQDRPSDGQEEKAP
mgnify:FL=1